MSMNGMWLASGRLRGQMRRSPHSLSCHQAHLTFTLCSSTPSTAHGSKKILHEAKNICLMKTNGSGKYRYAHQLPLKGIMGGSEGLTFSTTLKRELSVSLSEVVMVGAGETMQEGF